MNSETVTGKSRMIKNKKMYLQELFQNVEFIQKSWEFAKSKVLQF